MTGQDYKRPPITEAVIEIRYANPLDTQRLDKAGAALRRAYPMQQSVNTLGSNLQVNPSSGTLLQVGGVTGSRFSSIDQTELVVVWPQSFVVSQIAPYPGWDTFFTRFARDWRTLKSETGYHKVARVGVRYINRIDIPLKDRIVEEKEYLKLYAQVPDEFGPHILYGLQALFPADDQGCQITLNSAAVPSPLLDHASIVLDIDIAVTENPPQSDDAMFALLNTIREKKNNAFEACLTEQARELFRR